MTGPTEAHWRAVADALEKFLGRGVWRCYAPVTTTLPALEIRWDESALLRDDPERDEFVVGAVLFRNDGRIYLVLRSDISPERLHANALHELQHVMDADFARAGYPVAWLEARARQTAERLARLP